eukprot:29839_5
MHTTQFSATFETKTTTKDSLLWTRGNQISSSITVFTSNSLWRAAVKMKRGCSTHWTNTLSGERHNHLIQRVKFSDRGCT